MAKSHSIRRLCILVQLLFVSFVHGEEPGVISTESKVLEVYNSGPNLTNKARVTAWRMDSITIVVQNLTNWIHGNATNGMPKGSVEFKNLVPFINDIAIVGSQLIYDNPNAQTNYELTFKLIRDQSSQSSKDAWNALIGSVPSSKRFAPYPVKVSVGFDISGWEMDTDVTKDAKQFFVEVTPINGFTLAGFSFIVFLLCVFFKLASKFDIIRDAHAPLRPDGRAPFSLGRAQMAFWFFLVLSSFFLLWAMTGDMNTITGSVLALIGISAGTAIGAALVDAGKASEDGRNENVLLANPEQSNEQILADLLIKRKELQEKLAQKRNLLEALPVTEIVQRENNQKEQRLIERNIDRLKLQAEFYKRNRWQRFMVDILGDNGVVSFHRFQIVGWTLVLGIIFIGNVFSEQAMPDFSTTLLGLMGISSGTYLGFKFPEAKK